jgi:hypothetical protein
MALQGRRCSLETMDDHGVFQAKRNQEDGHGLPAFYRMEECEILVHRTYRTSKGDDGKARSEDNWKMPAASRRIDSRFNFTRK